VVAFTLGGTAVNGVDYESVPTSVTIPSGANSATVTITPKTSTSLVGDKTVTFTLSGGAQGAVPSSTAALGIAGNSIRSSLVKAGSGMQISWPSVVGKNYRIATRTSLTSGSWTDSGNVTAAGTTEAWTDSVAGENQKFYTVYITN
jgi:hypothetical protein